MPIQIYVTKTHRGSEGVYRVESITGCHSREDLPPAYLRGEYHCYGVTIEDAHVIMGPNYNPLVCAGECYSLEDFDSRMAYLRRCAAALRDTNRDHQKRFAQWAGNEIFTID